MFINLFNCILVNLLSQINVNLAFIWKVSSIVFSKFLLMIELVMNYFKWFLYSQKAWDTEAQVHESTIMSLSNARNKGTELSALIFLYDEKCFIPSYIFYIKRYPQSPDGWLVPSFFYSAHLYWISVYVSEIRRN